MSPRQLRRYVVLGFVTTHDSLAAEDALKEEGIPVTPVPTPGSLTGSLCGIVLRIEPADSDRARAELENREIEVQVEAEIEDV